MDTETTLTPGLGLQYYRSLEALVQKIKFITGDNASLPHDIFTS